MSLDHSTPPPNLFRESHFDSLINFIPFVRTQSFQNLDTLFKAIQRTRFLFLRQRFTSTGPFLISPGDSITSLEPLLIHIFHLIIIHRVISILGRPVLGGTAPI